MRSGFAVFLMRSFKSKVPEKKTLDKKFDMPVPVTKIIQMRICFQWFMTLCAAKTGATSAT